MPVSVVFPKFNIEKTSGEISNWLVSEGDKVSPGDVLFEVEDDKAAVEVDSTETGFIGELAETGEEIDVGSVVATIFESKEELDAAKTAPVADVKKSALAESSEPSPQPLQVAALRSTNVNPTPLARKIARENGIVLDGLNRHRPQRTYPEARRHRGPRTDLRSTIAGSNAAGPARPDFGHGPERSLVSEGRRPAGGIPSWLWF